MGQLLFCAQRLGIERSKVNPRGGAIAFGHPLGCTGARQLVTAISELKRTGKKMAVTSMCVGTVSNLQSIGRATDQHQQGMGMASLIVSEQ